MGTTADLDAEQRTSPAAETSRPTRSERWNACREKTCCRTSLIPLTGRDLARLTGAFEVPATDFAELIEIDPDDPVAFVLDPDGPWFDLVLRRAAVPGAVGTPCVFLVETNDGHALCGAGSAAPTACRAYPAMLARGELQVWTGVCSCHYWSHDDLGPAERELAVRADAERTEHAAVVHAWNTIVRGDRRPRSLQEYVRYAMTAAR